MGYKAVFFDRDGTLTHGDPKVREQVNDLIKGWGGNPFPIPYDRMIALFEQAAEGQRPWYRNVEDEIGFFNRYNALALLEYGVSEHLPQRAAQIHDMTWLNPATDAGGGGACQIFHIVYRQLACWCGKTQPHHLQCCAFCSGGDRCGKPVCG